MRDRNLILPLRQQQWLAGFGLRTLHAGWGMSEVEDTGTKPIECLSMKMLRFNYIVLESLSPASVSHLMFKPAECRR